jgi:hypothetical protein
MPTATFTKTAKIPVEIGNALTINLETNVWSLDIKVFENAGFKAKELFRGVELTAQGAAFKTNLQNLIDDYLVSAVNAATGMTITRTELRTAGLGYKIDAEAPVVVE